MSMKLKTVLPISMLTIQQKTNFLYILLFLALFFLQPLFLKTVFAAKKLTKGDRQLEKAVRSFKCKDYEKAAQQFILAVNQDSLLSDFGRLKHAECMKKLYKKSKKTEYMNQALDSFKRLIKFYPDSPFLYSACFQTALLYEEKSNFDNR